MFGDASLPQKQIDLIDTRRLFIRETACRISIHCRLLHIKRHIGHGRENYSSRLCTLQVRVGNSVILPNRDFLRSAPRKRTKAPLFAFDNLPLQSGLHFPNFPNFQANFPILLSGKTYESHRPSHSQTMQSATNGI